MMLFDARPRGLFLVLQVCSAWISHSPCLSSRSCRSPSCLHHHSFPTKRTINTTARRRPHVSLALSSSPSPQFSSDNSKSNNNSQPSDPVQLKGTSLIEQAFQASGGGDPASGIRIDWQSTKRKVVVTVLNVTNTYVSASASAENSHLNSEDHKDLGTVPTTAPPTTDGIDLAVLARAINEAFEEDNNDVLSLYTIEVTTPGTLCNNRQLQPLRGDVMFRAYKGFDVTARYNAPKQKKQQVLQGKLVERNDTHTILNVKGRMRKLLNTQVVEVCLPPAKKEKRKK